LPVNVDLENCYADVPRAAAEMIRLTAATGIGGGSIEDATGDPASRSTILGSPSRGFAPRPRSRAGWRCRSS